MVAQRELVDSAALLTGLAPELRACAAKTAVNELVNAQTATHLLGLPAELRNKIFEYALLEDEPIDVSPASSTQPGILRASRQTREETIPIYYQGNRFSVHIINFDAAAFVTFHDIIHDYMASSERGSNLVRTVSGPPNWKNLMRWMEAARANRTWTPQRSRTHEPVSNDHDAVFTLFQTVKHTMEDLPWEKVEQILTELRPMLGLLDSHWMDD